MNKKKLDGAVNESLAEQQIHKSDAIVRKIWWPIRTSQNQVL